MTDVLKFMCNYNLNLLDMFKGLKLQRQDQITKTLRKSLIGETAKYVCRSRLVSISRTRFVKKQVFLLFCFKFALKSVFIYHSIWCSE